MPLQSIVLEEDRDTPESQLDFRVYLRNHNLPPAWDLNENTISLKEAIKKMSSYKTSLTGVAVKHYNVKMND